MSNAEGISAAAAADVPAIPTRPSAPASGPATAQQNALTAPSGANPARAASTLQADPLAELRGLHLPDPIGWWPLAPGWWLLLGLSAVVATTTTVAVRRRRRSLARTALRELEGIPKAAATGNELQASARAIAAVLRRFALARFGRRRVAALHGDDWSRFLIETSSRRWRRGPAFDARIGAVLVSAPYARPASSIAGGTSPDAAEVIAAARAWIRRNA